MKTKLFAHRGHIFSKTQPDFKQNSIESLQNCYDLGYRAVEFDIWFVEDKLVLKHDRPNKNELLPTLSDYFRYKNELEYWMDFKNLSAANCALALELVAKEIERAKIDLNKIYFAPFITNLTRALPVYREIVRRFQQEAQIMAICEIKKRNLAQYAKYKEHLISHQIKFLSINHQLIDLEVAKIFSDQISLFAWTVNDVDRIQTLEQLGVRNFATDKIIPQTYPI